MEVYYKKLSYASYILLLTGSAGYYGYYLQSKEHFFVWAIIFISGMILLIIKNNYILKNNSSKTAIYLDMLFLLGICLMPSLKMPNGLSILLTVLGGAIYAYKTIQSQFNSS